MVCFLGCKKITGIPYNFLNNNILIEDLSDLFSGCSNLTKITDDLNIPYNVKNINRMFKSCTSMESNNMQFVGYDNITSAVETFSNCVALSTLPTSFKLSRTILNFAGFCFNCKELKTLPSSFWPETFFISRTIKLDNAFNTNGKLEAKLPNKILWDDNRITWDAKNAFFNITGENNITAESGVVPSEWLRVGYVLEK